MQATEVLKELLGLGTGLVGQLVLYDALDQTMRKIRVKREKVPEIWRSGIKRTLLSVPRRTHVLVMDGIPDNRLDPVRCLRKNRLNISKCVTPRQTARQRVVERTIKRATRSSGESYRSINGRVCTYDPCPVIHGDVLVWRNRRHYTATFSATLTPTFRSLLPDVFSSATGSR